MKREWGYIKSSRSFKLCQEKEHHKTSESKPFLARASKWNKSCHKIISYSITLQNYDMTDFSLIQWQFLQEVSLSTKKNLVKLTHYSQCISQYFRNKRTKGINGLKRDFFYIAKEKMKNSS